VRNRALEHPGLLLIILVIWRTKQARAAAPSRPQDLVFREEESVPLTRREILAGTAVFVSSAAVNEPSRAQPPQNLGIQPEDRVFVCNEDSNTLAVIDPRTNTIETAVNLTSFDEDPRPSFRFVTGGVAPTHVAMVQKPLYHGAISIHGAAPSPDNSLIATTGRGSSNVYLIDTRSKKVLGNRPNPQAKSDTVLAIISKARRRGAASR
jgi:YVTN family beta-propeller protein